MNDERDPMSFRLLRPLPARPHESAGRTLPVILLILGAVLLALAIPGRRYDRAVENLREAHAAGVAGKTVDYLRCWIPRVAQGVLPFWGLLVIFRRVVMRPLPRGGVPLPAADPAGTRLLGVVTLAAVIWSAWANAPRLDHSLWGDEESTMRKSVVGEFEQQEDGSLRYRPVSWLETVYRYRDPNNHILHSILSRMSHELFARDTTQPDGFYFDERAIRLPVFAAGLLGLAAVAWFCQSIGRPRTGCAAVALLALHPWFVRYAVEARGYGLLFLLVPATMAFLARAARTGRWRWWLGFGIGQFLILWVTPATLYLLVALNLSALGVILLPGVSGAWRRVQACRLAVGLLTGAVLSAFAYVPCVQPLIFYLKSARMQGTLDARWYSDTFSYLTTGQAWFRWDLSNPWCHTWQQALAANPVLTAAGIILLDLVLLLGVIGWWREGGLCRALVPALVLYIPLAILHALLTGSTMYPWYLMPGMPGLVLLGAGGLALLARLLQPAGGWLAATAAIALYAWGTADQRKVLRTVDLEPMRQGTKLTRAVSLPSDPRIHDVITLDIAHTTRGYDPASRPVAVTEDPTPMIELLREADAAGKPVFAHIGNPGFARSVRPRHFAILDDPGIFDRIAVLYGLDHMCTREVFAYRPGAVRKLAPEAAPPEARPDSDP